MRIAIVLVALFACAMGASWPRLPLQLVLSGRFDHLERNRIVGGSEVQPENDLPFQVRLERRAGSGGSLSCGGSIISAKTILNAAHCVQSFVPSTYRIVAGEHNALVASGREQYADIERAIYHPLYNSATFENDISVIILVNELTLNEWVQPIGLPAASLDNTNVAAGTIVTISGWGSTSSGGSISQILLSVDAPVVSDEDCSRAYAGQYAIADSMICAGKLGEGGVDSCQGDSGGPLFTRSVDNEFTQWGIVSWGIGCARPAYPGVYTETTYFRTWIEANMQ